MLLGAPEALAGGAVWHEKRVVVKDFTLAFWDGVFAQTVMDMNVMLPTSGPRLSYRRMAVAGCQSVRKRKRAGTITVCSSPLPAGGITTRRFLGNALTSAHIAVFDAWPTIARDPMFPAHAACHEMMHALTSIRDNRGAAPDTSCVWGTLASPGPFDVAYAKKVCKRHR